MCNFINNLFYIIGVLFIFSSVICSLINCVIRKHLKNYHPEIYKGIGLDDDLYDDAYETTKNYSNFFKNKSYVSLNDYCLNLLARMRLGFSLIMFFLFLFILITLYLVAHFECKLSLDDFLGVFSGGSLPDAFRQLVCVSY